VDGDIAAALDAYLLQVERCSLVVIEASQNVGVLHEQREDCG
jgi:hypothetical protein